jgi:type IV pilus assembly protein PilV
MRPVRWSPPRNGTLQQVGGFTLIEVLVALLVLSVGLLGLAGLQLHGLRNSHNAYLRSQAVFLAYDIADRMRANRPGIQAGSYDGLDTSKSYDATDCKTNSCDVSTMAAADAYEWKEALKGLPSGKGTIENNGDGTFMIAVSWTERILPTAPDDSQNPDDPSPSDSFTYRMVIRP